MGGPGSGNHDHWWRPPRKRTADKCLSLDANQWTRAGILKAGVRQSGAWQWTDTRTGQVIASVAFAVDTRDSGDPWVRLSYTIPKTGQQLDYDIGLCTTRPHFGGRRWWFRCPVPNDSGVCGRRVAKLYLPSRGTMFGCRQCHGLTYQSCQDSGRFDALFRRLAQSTGLDFDQVKRTLVRPGRQPGD